MKKWITGMMALAVLTALPLTGCGQIKSSNENGLSTTGDKKATTAVSNTSNDQQVQNVYVVVEAGSKKGPDNKMHDAFINGDFTVTAGKPVKVTFFNYDEGAHTMSAPKLGMNVTLKGSEKTGEPAVTEYTFTPKDAGSFEWQCMEPCDSEAGGWAMSHDGYMKGHITVAPATDQTQHVSLVINAGYKLGPDGKLHDAFTPGDFSIHSGSPVELSIFNFDDGQHTLTSKDLGLNVAVAGSKGKGEPSMTQVTFTPQKAGKFQWNCMIPCDGEQSAWAMSHDNYMTGFVTVN